ncbi:MULTISPECIES: 16S rRNA (cytidine(1402)-2'-O)-methyltransferase [unclassified Halomonas]|uniref:16S rRNA (cytidine(1402)-2'-O)-methyltransferase n=1 Tax=unclassified Halomonas TaxID=2609666 RepID=UPI001C979B7E|nr:MULTISPECIES: 16S rRNA (cytidine(1402)-2'-O)-methyltransferase [unclassified Halomonas]MBY5925609.1 16S rRNA (cytidine(1402)-2'-O)-methyltransferase [Halomonas sp. DP4Y7-2]MBY6030667.1 16S rRNA (cytidine(1402)-2'-O)-methyltransferase [Halomonas sp. DP8Y7-1]MBY6232572.1 16S rRNA (cytidine(1402)-2'-O)-methyltransferase [Halomonas sp. DP4Y7-1]MED5296771.1 16S rRNA (cytidine(1402)-2'-O)-methyltransferase [Pseudomonadota bacterium]
MSEVKAGSLYVVATPIGNLEDLSPRAAAVLGRVALVAAEDTRHSARLMRHLGVAPAMVSVHDHNEASRVELLKRRLLEGDDVALISDAGTPLISDPGFVVVRELRQQGFSIVPIPGPCALITALSAAGLPTSSFTFHGFLPAKGSGRRARLETWRGDTGTQVCYESPHRIKDLLADLAALLGDRQVVLGRELTKTFETFLDGTAAELLAVIEEDPNQARGEFVVMVAGATEVASAGQAVEEDALLRALLDEGVGVKQAAGVAARVLGGAKKTWYAKAQSLKDGD